MPLNEKNNHIKWTEHELFKCSKLSSLFNCYSLNRHWSVLLDHMTLTLDRGDKREILNVNLHPLFFYPFLKLFSKVWILLLKKPNSHWSRVNTWVGFWQLNNNFLYKSELYWPPNWINPATPVGNNTDNTITMSFRTQIGLQFC